MKNSAAVLLGSLGGKAKSDKKTKANRQNAKKKRKKQPQEN